MPEKWTPAWDETGLEELASLVSLPSSLLFLLLS
jgi:hypothetical protein